MNSLYGDSARIIGLSELESGLDAGLVGLPANLGNPPSTNGLYCGGSIAPDMVSQPRAFLTPTIADVHAYNNISASDASYSFNDYKSFLNSFGPSGWRGSNPNLYNAEVMLGETHSGTTQSGSNPPVSCEGYPNPSQLAGYMVNGFNMSTLTNGNRTVFRPWMNSESACYPWPIVVNPPYTPTP